MIAEVSQGQKIDRNGNIAHALRSDDNAKEWLRRVGVDECNFTRIHNTPCTLLSLASKWLGVTNLAQRSKKDFLAMKPFGVYILDELEPATKALKDLGLGLTGYTKWIQSDGLCFLSYRALLIISLTARTSRGGLLRELMGVRVPSPPSVSQILEMGGVANKSASIEPAVVQIENYQNPEPRYRSQEEAIKHLFSSEDVAFNALKKAGIEIPFTLYQGRVPCTIKTNLTALLKGIPVVSPDTDWNKVRSFYAFKIDSYEEAKPIIEAVTDTKPIFLKGAFGNDANSPYFVTPRTIVASLLTRQGTDRLDEIRRSIGVPERISVDDLLSMVGLQYEKPQAKESPVIEQLTLKDPTHNAVNLPPIPKQGDDPDEVIKELCSFLSDSEGIKMLIDRARRKLFEIDSQIEALSQERSIYANTIDRASRLI